MVPPFILSVVIPRVQIECVGLFRVCFLFLTAFSVTPSRTLRKIQNFKKYEFSSEFQNFFDTHTSCKVCWFVCRYILNWSSTLILRKKKPVCLFWSFFQWEEKCLSPDAPRHLVYQISLSSYRRDWPTVFDLCPAFDSVSIFIFFSRFFISFSVPTTDEPDWSFFFTYFEWLFYTYTDERCYRVVFFFPFLDVLSLISVIIYLYIYIMFSKGAGKEVWLFSGNLLANTRATWGQGSFEKKLLWLFLIKVIKWTINGDCGKGRREIQKRMGGKLIS